MLGPVRTPRAARQSAPAPRAWVCLPVPFRVFADPRSDTTPRRLTDRVQFARLCLTARVHLRPGLPPTSASEGRRAAGRSARKACIRGGFFSARAACTADGFLTARKPCIQDGPLATTACIQPASPARKACILTTPKETA